MGPGGDDQRPFGWTLSRRQLLGGGLLGAAGVAVGSVFPVGAGMGAPAGAVEEQPGDGPGVPVGRR